jgi:aerobic C4-dicarboxylate transport protein
MADVADVALKEHKPIYYSLYFQVIVGITLGILLGFFFPDFAAQLKPLGDAFIKLIKMMIGPIIFGTVAVGIAKMGDLKEVGRVGLKALIYFEVLTTVALVIGLVVANVYQPGAGINADPASFDTKAVAAYTTKAQQLSTVDYLMHIIPNTVVGAFAEGEILQVLLFAVLFGLALSQFGEKGRTLVKVLDEATHVLFRIIGIIMRLAPIGAFGAMAFTIGKYGIATLPLTCPLTGLVLLWISLGAARYSRCSPAPSAWGSASASRPSSTTSSPGSFCSRRRASRSATSSISKRIISPAPSARSTFATPS